MSLGKTMGITLIYAECRGVIAIDGNLPVHLSEDLKFFKRFTMGKTLVMGRKTVERLPKKLEGRTVICLTRDKHYSSDKCDVVFSTLEQVYEFCQGECVEELLVAGGGEIYDLFLKSCNRVVKTRINHTILPKREFQKAPNKMLGPDLKSKGEFSSADVIEKTSKMTVIDFRWGGDEI